MLEFLSNLISYLSYIFIICWIVRIFIFIYENVIRQNNNILNRYGTDSWALVTGGSDGIGKEISISLAEKGFNLLIVSRTESKLQAFCEEIQKTCNVQAEYIALDFKTVSTYDEYEKIFIDHFRQKPIKVLVNNVGYMKLEKMKDMDIQDVYDTVVVNCFPQTYLTKIYIDNLGENKGGIINLSSTVTEAIFPYFNLYAPTKVYNDYFSKGISLEEKNIDSLSVRPGPVQSDLSGLKSNGFTVLSAKQCSNGLFKYFTFNKETNGHILHTVQSYFLSCLPEIIVPYLAERFVKKMFGKTDYSIRA